MVSVELPLNIIGIKLAIEADRLLQLVRSESTVRRQK